MNRFATKYLIAVMTLGVMCMFTQDSETIKALVFIGLYSIVLCFVESFIIDCKETKKGEEK